MWLWTVLIYLLVFNQTLSQPISNKGDNVRETRQLDIGECCPCTGFGTNDARAMVEKQTPATSNGPDIFGSAREMDDCPCKFRENDQEGASSILFPAAMRAARPFLRPTETKEDLKPLLHPEVDLASSVLETLREATNEEYHEALARDALRDAVKIAELSVPTFIDVAPEESRNVFTILVNPKQDEDEVVAQPSHNQESRCIHAPSGRARENLGKLKMIPQHSNLENILNLPKSKPLRLLHKKIIDMDNNVAASDVEEHIMHFGKEQTNRNIELKPLLKIRPLIQNTSLSTVDSDCNPDLKSTLTQSIESTINENTVSKTRSDSSLPETTKNNVDKNDLAVLPSNLEERLSVSTNTAVKKVPNFRKTTVEDILKKAATNWKNIFKLKDVELIPFEALNKPIQKPTRLSAQNKNDFDYKTNVFLNKECSSDATEHLQINTAPEILTIPSPLNTIINFDSTPISTDNEQLLTTNDCESTLDSDEISNKNNDFNIQKSCEQESNTATIQAANDEMYRDYSTNTQNVKDFKTYDKQNLKNINDGILVPNSIENSQEKISDLNEDNMTPQQSTLETSTSKFTLFKPPLENKTLLKAQKIKSRLENLKTINTDLTGLFNRSVSSEKATDSAESDCVDKMTEEFNVSLKPSIPSNGDVTSVTMQDLQNISNSLLQKEEESIIKKTIEYNDNENSLEMDNISRDSSIPNETFPDQEEGASSREENKSNVCDPTFSALTTVKDINEMDSINSERNHNNNNLIISNLAQTRITSENNNLPNLFDNTEPSLSQSSPGSNIFRNSLPILRNILTSPAIDGKKFKLLNIFNSTERHATEKLPLQEEKRDSISSDEFQSDMATDSSTTNSQIKHPALGLLGKKNIDLDIFQLNPLKSLKNSPHTFNTGLKNDFTLKPIQFKHPLETNIDVFGSSLTSLPKNIHVANVNPFENSLTRKVSEVLSNVAESFPTVDDLRNQMRSPTKELLNAPSFFENVDGILDLSNIKNNAENSIKNIGQQLKSATIDLKSPNQYSNHLLDAASNRQNDLHEKLRAIHIDLNDRLESLRSSRISTKNLQINENNREGNKIKMPTNKLFKDFGNKDRPILLKSRKPETVTKDYLPGLDKKFKLPHMPVPKTVEIPKLKATPTKTNNLKDSIFFTSKNIPNTEPPPSNPSTAFTKQLMKDLQNVNNHSGKQIEPFKNKSNIKSFLSTTSRPSFTLKPRLISKLKPDVRDTSPYDNSKKQSTLQFKDSKGSLSETKPISILTPQSSNYDELKYDVSSKVGRDSDVSYASGEIEPLMSNINKPLKSWPKVTDSSFIDKVKEAVHERLPKTISAKRMEIEDISSSLKKSVLNKNDNNYPKDILSSASENLEINNSEALKENVSYRCRMVCTKE